MKNSMQLYPEDFPQYKRYISEVKKYPLLSRLQEQRLLDAVQDGDEKAFHKLICSNLRFVIKIAFMYRNQGLPVTDLINEGNLGLMEAAKRYDKGKKVRFTSYAVWWVRQAITQALFEKARLVRLSAANELQIRRIGKLPAKSRQVIGSGSHINTEDLARRMGCTPMHMERLLKMNQPHTSLDTSAFGNTRSAWKDNLVEGTFGRPDDELTRRSLEELIAQSLQHLNKNERKVLTLLFGLQGNKAMNLRELGELLQLSKERIRQIREESLDKLRSLKLSRKHLLAA